MLLGGNELNVTPVSIRKIFILFLTSICFIFFVMKNTNLLEDWFLMDKITIINNVKLIEFLFFVF